MVTEFDTPHVIDIFHYVGRDGVDSAIRDASAIPGSTNTSFCLRYKGPKNHVSGNNFLAIGRHDVPRGEKARMNSCFSVATASASTPRRFERTSHTSFLPTPQAPRDDRHAAGHENPPHVFRGNGAIACKPTASASSTGVCRNRRLLHTLVPIIPIPLSSQPRIDAVLHDIQYPFRRRRPTHLSPASVEGKGTTVWHDDVAFVSIRELPRLLLVIHVQRRGINTQLCCSRRCRVSAGPLWR